jgi:hypothetical protein
MRLVLAVALTLALGACNPGDTRKVDTETAAAPQPSESMRQTFAACTWGEVKGAKASIWSMACGPDAGDVRLEADDALPGFVLVSGVGATAMRHPAIRLFPKEAGAPLDAILPAVRAASPGPQTATCAFTAAPGVDHAGKTRYTFGPTGAAKEAYEKAIQGPDVPEAPCGPMGPSEAGDRTFEEIAPDLVAYVDWGSDIQVFDPATLKAAAAH